MQIRWLLIVLTTSFVYESVVPQPAINEGLFLCQPTSEINGTPVFTPNISDSYFNTSIVEQLRRSGGLDESIDRIYVFSVPDESEQRRNCSGSVVAIEYCYRVHNRTALQENEQDVFMFHSLIATGNGSRLFTVNGSYMVKTTPSRNCTENRLFCCDRTTLNAQFPSSSYAFGVKIVRSGVRQLRFTETSNFIFQNCRFTFPQYDCSRVNASVLLLRLLIGITIYNHT